MVIVLLGFLLGDLVFTPSQRSGHTFDYAAESYANWDGQWYKDIARRGLPPNSLCHRGR
jgi:hypothetical protein